jgi:DNA-binding CsgD family transcriptional regulator
MAKFDALLQDAAERMINAVDITDLMAITASVLSVNGCDHFAFFGSSNAVFGSPELGAGIAFFYTNLPALGQIPNPCGNNVTVRRALAQGNDSLWSDPTIWLDATAQEAAQFERFKSLGLARGFTAALSGQPGYYTGIWFHLDHLSDTDFAQNWHEMRPKLMAIAQVFDRLFLNKHIIAHYGLSVRERDVLAGLAMGLRPDQIAHRFGIGAGTVDKYIVAAKAKLAARTRDHAVARALMLGLLDLSPYGDFSPISRW